MEHTSFRIRMSRKDGDFRAIYTWPVKIKLKLFDILYFQMFFSIAPGGTIWQGVDH